ncbi:MAG: ABC transporter ATP-binding protein [Desulfatibacillaceae bacterium]|nr:ABC transporter ATP-binding protein [Desulfatibacillaceae bacterium]
MQGQSFLRSRLMSTLIGQLGPFGSRWLTASVLMVLASASLLAFPWWAKSLFTTIVPGQDLAALAQHLAIGAGLVFLVSALTFSRDFIMGRLAFESVARIRRAMFQRVLEMPAVHLEKDESDIKSRLSNDISLLADSLLGVVMIFVPNALTLLALAGAMIWYAPALSLITLALSIPLFWATGYFVKKVYLSAQNAQERLPELVSIADQAVRGAREIRIFSLKSRFMHLFDDAGQKALNAQTTQVRAMALHPAAVAVFHGLSVGILLLLCAWLVWSNRLPADNLLAFFTCLLLMGAPLGQVSNSTKNAGRMLAVWERCQKLLAADNNKDDALPDIVVQGKALEVENLSFAYGPYMAPAILDVSFTVPPKSVLAIAGPSGAGKSTLLALLARFYEPDSGRILVGGHDIRAFNRQSLRQNMGAVFQEPMLFSGTLWENIAIGNPNADQAQILKAAADAHVSEFAIKLVNGYQTLVGPGGQELSVGQRQRVAIARAFLKNPPLLLLDEPFSALDRESARLVGKALVRLGAGRTTIIAAHRASLMQMADFVIVLNQGRLVEQGSHPELLEKGSLYPVLFQTALNTPFQSDLHLNSTQKGPSL